MRSKRPKKGSDYSARIGFLLSGAYRDDGRAPERPSDIAARVPAELARAASPAAPRGKYDRSLETGERKTEQSARLLSAAAEIFARKGFTAATVEQIVQRAGMSRRTFYEHFTGLRHALLALHEQAAELSFAFVEHEVRSKTDPLDKLTAGVTVFLALLARHGDLARVLFREVRAAGPDLEAQRQAVLARFAALIAEGVAEAHARGLAARPPDELTVFALVSAIEAVGMRYVERKEEERALEAAPALIELVVRAFA